MRRERIKPHLRGPRAQLEKASRPIVALRVYGSFSPPYPGETKENGARRRFYRKLMAPIIVALEQLTHAASGFRSQKPDALVPKLIAEKTRFLRNRLRAEAKCSVRCA